MAEIVGRSLDAFTVTLNEVAKRRRCLSTARIVIVVVPEALGTGVRLIVRTFDALPPIT